MVNLIAISSDELKIRSDFPHEIRIDTDLRIPLHDGRSLSARMWIPVSAGAIPVPAVVEYAPFRHRDFTYPRDAIIHPWFAGHGYASIRLEPSGAMDSDGPPLDEYVLQEQTDCIEALEWIAAQPWCSGRTGLFGMSWGAFSAIQVAAHRPPSLKAIIPVHGTDERFGDDIHYKGGCLLTANLAWGALYQTYMMRPPFRDATKAEWRDNWINRMAAAPDILKAWLTHQNRDDYWTHASICENASAIEAATFVICGWADGYTNAATRMAQSLTCPHRVLIGPWAHSYPHIALPGPQVGFLQLATEWWDRWLKDIDNGAERAPKVVYYMRGSAKPAPSYKHRDGRWIAEETWPSPNSVVTPHYLNTYGMDASAKPGPALTLRTPLGNAMTGWEWLPHGVGPEMPLDQRIEDAGSLCFDTGPLDSAIEICGQPKAHLKIASDSPRGTLSIRLSDVAPDGSSTLICYGLLNLMHRHGFGAANPVVPSEWQDVVVPLDEIAQTVPAGHRVRLSVSTQSWPLTWPAPTPMTLTLAPGESRIDLPLRNVTALDGAVPELYKAETPPLADLTWLRPVKRERTLTTDLATGAMIRSYVKDDGAYVVNENSQIVASRAVYIYRSTGEDPLTAEADLSFDLEVGDADDPVQLSCRVNVTCDLGNLIVKGHISAHAGSTEVHHRVLDLVIPRIAS